MRKLTLSLATILATSTFAFAGGDIVPVMEPVIETPMVIEDEVVSDSGVYVGLGYSLLRSTSKYGQDDLANDYSAGMAQIGYKFNEYISVEGRYWYGIAEELDKLNTAVFGKFDSEAAAWGVYAKPMYPVTEELDVYALVGYGASSVNGTKLANGTTMDVEVAGLSWGVGAAYSFTENFSVFADYVDFQDDTEKVNLVDFENAFDSINLGVTYKF